jgi:hypothetical protein
LQAGMESLHGGMESLHGGIKSFRGWIGIFNSEVCSARWLLGGLPRQSQTLPRRCRIRRGGGLPHCLGREVASLIRLLTQPTLQP